MLLIRPDPQILWSGEKKDPPLGPGPCPVPALQLGGRQVANYKKVPPRVENPLERADLRLKTMGFKHTGIFPEQAVNWEFAMEKIRQAGRPP